MGMSIDDVIRYFKDMKKACCCGTEQATIAIDTMRKYQKLEDYMKRLEKNGQYGTLRKLKIVLGEVDNG